MSVVHPIDYHAPREIEHPLASMDETEVRTLMWTQEQPMRPAYELWAGERVVATLRYRGLVQDGAMAAANDGLWTIGASGDGRGHVVVTANGRPVAELRRNGGLTDSLFLNGQMAYHWMLKDLWRKDRSFADAEGRTILVCRPESNGKARTRVSLAPGARFCPDLSLLLVLAQYLMLLPRRKVTSTLHAFPGGLSGS